MKDTLKEVLGENQILKFEKITVIDLLFIPPISCILFLREPIDSKHEKVNPGFRYFKNSKSRIRFLSIFVMKSKRVLQTI